MKLATRNETQPVQRLASLVAESLHKVENTVGKANFFAGLGKEVGSQRRKLTRFGHDGVAHRERWADFP